MIAHGNTVLNQFKSQWQFDPSVNEMTDAKEGLVVLFDSNATTDDMMTLAVACSNRLVFIMVGLSGIDKFTYLMGKTPDQLIKTVPNPWKR